MRRRRMNKRGYGFKRGRKRSRKGSRRRNYFVSRGGVRL